MTTTFRTTVVFDYVVPDGTDPDVFHDELRDHLENESEHLTFHLMSAGEDDDPTCVLETVRDIDVQVLDD